MIASLFSSFFFYCIFFIVRLNFVHSLFIILGLAQARTHRSSFFNYYNNIYLWSTICKTKKNVGLLVVENLRKCNVQFVRKCNLIHHSFALKTVLKRLGLSISSAMYPEKNNKPRKTQVLNLQALLDQVLFQRNDLFPKILLNLTIITHRFQKNSNNQNSRNK